ncbi:hypothetical protein [Candidatus Magnetomonas plexicatena]|uniref:hypothetical protein n=1 Tax=Candidatus Magnetomonas plexicatena TaxID=2552947 RepID=UPI0011043E44|nr:hypothetical protein E2O03_007330 [Nitrospirales bacterium LBB_01]
MGNIPYDCTKFKCEDLIEIYKQFRTEKHKSIDLHLQHFRNYLTLLSAIFAGILYIFVSPKTSLFALPLIFGLSFSGAGLAWRARKTCDRFYLGVVEAITMSAKIEDLLGLTSNTLLGTRPESERPFPNDLSILPQRWICDWFKSTKTKAYKCNKFKITIPTEKEQNQFQEAMMKEGSNKYVTRTFYVFIGVYVLIAIVSAFYYIGNGNLNALLTELETFRLLKNLKDAWGQLISIKNLIFSP